MSYRPLTAGSKSDVTKPNHAALFPFGRGHLNWMPSTEVPSMAVLPRAELFIASQEVAHVFVTALESAVLMNVRQSLPEGTENAGANGAAVVVAPPLPITQGVHV